MSTTASRTRTTVMAAATAQEAGHQVVAEPMAQLCAPEETLRALTPENCRLMALIHRYRPQSITELCRLAARPQPNVSRSLAALERAGIVSMAGSRPKRPEFAVQRVTIDLAELPEWPMRGRRFVETNCRTIIFAARWVTGAKVDQWVAKPPLTRFRKYWT
ncbi:helix-turn-helix domain-containing protein [Mesorhizobium sp. M1088]|uniref:HVO_A0114 family putative DNA-binding protein n=1 Tax=Mesorhizobium sp. M1088 TaxID=2957056 RepID=UPI00333A3700